MMSLTLKDVCIVAAAVLFLLTSFANAVKPSYIPLYRTRKYVRHYRPHPQQQQHQITHGWSSDSSSPGTVIVGWQNTNSNSGHDYGHNSNSGSGSGLGWAISGSGTGGNQGQGADVGWSQSQWKSSQRPSKTNGNGGGGGGGRMKSGSGFNRNVGAKGWRNDYSMGAEADYSSTNPVNMIPISGDEAWKYWTDLNARSRRGQGQGGHNQMGMGQQGPAVMAAWNQYIGGSSGYTNNY